MGIDGVVGHQALHGGVHEGFVAHRVAGHPHQLGEHAELGAGKIDAVALPRREQRILVEHQLTDALGGGADPGAVLLGAHFVDAQQRRDPLGQVVEADGLGQVVPGAQPQPGDLVDLVDALGEEDHRQARRAGEHVATQLKTGVHLLAEDDVENDQVGERLVEARQGLFAAAVGRDLIAFLGDRIRVVGTLIGIVLDDGDGFGHPRVPAVSREGFYRVLARGSDRKNSDVRSRVGIATTSDFTLSP